MHKSRFAVVTVYKNQMQVITFTGAVGPGPIVCPDAAWTSAAVCFKRLPASV